MNTIDTKDSTNKQHNVNRRSKYSTDIVKHPSGFYLDTFLNISEDFNNSTM